MLVDTGIRIRISSSPCVPQSKSQCQLGLEVNGKSNSQLALGFEFALLRAPVYHKANPSANWDLKLMENESQLALGFEFAFLRPPVPCKANPSANWDLKLMESKSQLELGFEFAFLRALGPYKANPSPIGTCSL